MGFGARAAEFYLSPTGDDSNPGTKSRPFATLARARDAVRERKRGKTSGNYNVLLRGGIYRRTFAHGLVLVNPHVTTSRRVRLRGTYSGSGLGRIRSVVLGPTSGVVLVRRS